MPDNTALDVEHEIQRLMLKRLGIEWIPGEPFYSLIEAEIDRLHLAAREGVSLRAQVIELRRQNDYYMRLLTKTTNDLG